MKLCENHSKYAVNHTDFIVFSDCYNWLSVSMENSQNFRYGLSLCLKMVHLLGVKLEIRQIFGVIIQFFVCGSEFRARWHVWMKDSRGA
jgi:hypothetical protein